MTDDEKPPTVDEPPKPPVEPPADPPPADPPKPPADPHKPPGEPDKIPAWGQELTNKVEGLLEAIKPPMPEHGEHIDEDTNPVKPAWKDRSLKSFFGFE